MSSIVKTPAGHIYAIGRPLRKGSLKTQDILAPEGFEAIQLNPSDVIMMAAQLIVDKVTEDQ